MIRVVLDTNIIISSIFWKGNPHEVFRRGILGEYQLVASTEILDEVANKLRTKFKFPEKRQPNSWKTTCLTKRSFGQIFPYRQ